jgi:hypothetical protein
MIRRRWAAALLLVVLAAACGSSAPTGSISASSYDRRCTTVADCFPVYEGVVGCCGVGCPNTAVRQDQATQYMSDVNRLEAASCMKQATPCPQPLCDGDRLQCASGVCQLEAPADGGP